MRRLIVCAVCGLLGLAVPAAASAAELSISVPRQPPSEDAAFSIGVNGDSAGAGGATRVIVEARPFSGLACGSTPDANPGDVVVYEQVDGIFYESGTYTAADPVDQLACGWIVDSFSRVIAGPSSGIVRVRPPELRLFVNAPGRVQPGSTLPVGVDYLSEVSRQLVVVYGAGTGCDVSPDALLRAVGELQTIANLANVVERGGFEGAALADYWGQYIVCGYLVDRALGTLAPSQLVTSASVRVGGPRRRCAAVGGRRGITQIFVGGITCDRGRSIARRWGRARRRPRTISGLECRRLSGRMVVCAGYQGEVTFRYRR